jgi:tRNA (Thr-GGU) A37 N-methylase
MEHIPDRLRLIGHIRSALQSKEEAPRQGNEGAPDAWLHVDPAFEPALRGVARSPESSRPGLPTGPIRWGFIE